MSTHAETVTVLQSEFERLTQYLAALPTAAWTTPSACTDWAVRIKRVQATRKTRAPDA
jgi:Mycothiol maleylpyruvate isomerase N-terminal domain